MKGINYIRGTSKVTVKGSCEEALNRVSAHNILVWGASETDEGTVFYVRTSAVRALLTLYPDAKIEGRGMPQKLKKLIRRYTLLLTALLLFALWFISGNLVWEFSVSGNEKVQDAEILAVLKDAGVTYGSVGFKIDSEKLSNLVLSEIPELSWFAINVNGSRAQILVRERILKPDIVDPNELTDVRAEKGGVILSMDVYDGTPVVHPGDTVEKGQLLVSGITESFTGFRTEHALAKIYARTDYELTASLSRNSTGKDYTGESHTAWGIEICGVGADAFADCGFENYDKHVTKKQLTAGDGKLPVYFTKTEYFEYVPAEREMSVEECEKVLKEELSAMLRESTSGDILAVLFETECEGSVVTVTLRAQVREEISG